MSIKAVSFENGPHPERVRCRRRHPTWELHKPGANPSERMQVRARHHWDDVLMCIRSAAGLADAGPGIGLGGSGWPLLWSRSREEALVYDNPDPPEDGRTMWNGRTIWGGPRRLDREDAQKLLREHPGEYWSLDWRTDNPEEGMYQQLAGHAMAPKRMPNSGTSLLSTQCNEAEDESARVRPCSKVNSAAHKRKTHWAAPFSGSGSGPSGPAAGDGRGAASSSKNGSRAHGPAPRKEAENTILEGDGESGTSGNAVVSDLSNVASAEIAAGAKGSPASGSSTLASPKENPADRDFPSRLKHERSDSLVW